MTRNSGYLGNPNLKPEGEAVNFTKEQVEEYIKCARDPVYFIQKYIKVVSLDKGLVPFHLFDYQEQMIKTIHDNRFVIAKLPRQSGKTTTVTSYLLHYILFNQSMNIAILANKQSTAKDILARLKLAYEYLPKWLQQGIKEWNKYSIALENGSKVLAAATSSSAIRGGSYNCISGNSIITIKNTDTDEIIDISIEDFHKLAQSSRNTNNYKYLYANDRQQIQEMVFFSDRKSTTSNIKRRDIERKTSHYSNILGRRKQNHKYGLFDDSGTFISTSSSSEIFNRNRKIENVSCLFSNGTWKTGEIYNDVEFCSKNINDGIFGSEENNENGIETLRRNEKENKYIELGENQFNRNQEKNINSKYRKIGRGEKTEGVWRKNIQSSNRKKKNKGTFGQDQQESRENKKDCGKTSWNETQRRSEEKYEYSSKKKMCVEWPVEPRIEKNKWQVYTSKGFKNFHGISKTYNQPTVEIITSDNTIVCTPDHKISTPKGFLCANRLTVGSCVTTDRGSSEIVEIKEKGNSDVYDLLQVEDIRAFYANGIEVHNCILLDEYAHVPTNVAEEFFSSVYPTITSGQTTRVIMISTPKGLNMFYHFWKGAQSKQNEYVPIEVTWDQVPKYPGGPRRDEEWKKETIRNSSERQFAEEFECNFIGSSNTLISSEKLNALTWVKPISKTNDGLTFFVDPIKETETTPLHTYYIVVDVARGQGKDYSAFTVIDITQMPYKVVAKYRNNIVSPLLFPSIIRSIGKRYNDAYVMVELNDIGSQVADILHRDLEYENLIKSNMKGRKGQIITEGFGGGKSQQLGIRTSQVVKKLGCSVLKNLIENDKLIVEDAEIIEELTTFISSNSSFSAESGYSDDLVMTLVLFSWSTRQDFFKNLTNTDVRLEMYDQDIKKIEDELLPFGYLSDGVVDDIPEETPEEWSSEDRWLIVDKKTQNDDWIDIYKQNKFF